MTEGENVIDLPVTDDWGTGAYVTVSALRPLGQNDGIRTPVRALGIAHAQIDPAARALAASLELPAEADPRGPLDVAVKVDGITAGESAFVTIAAVDQGILNLTGHLPPDPFAHYFGQRKLGMGIRDIYGRLIDTSNGAMGMVRSGGDAGANARLQAPPPTEELVAFFSGPIKVGADGYARTSFALPAFNGTVKVMALAWSKTGIGQANADVLVRDPVVIAAALPRFMALGDSSRLALDITHATGPAGAMGLKISSAGLSLGDVPASIDLAEKAMTRIEVALTARQLGPQTVEIALTTPDGKVLTKTLHLPVQINDAPIVRNAQFELAKGSTFTADAALFDGLVPGSARATVSAGPIARLNAAGLLSALDGYPYGCTEQMTSKAMPLLYLSQLGETLGITTPDDLPSKINAALNGVLVTQNGNGAFGLWQAGDGGDMWLDAYITDFLGRARAQGYSVPDAAFRSALDNLRNQVNYHPDFDYGGEGLAYALMVLAREGAAAIGDLRYYADVKGDAFATPAAMAQLGAALAMYGDQPRSDAMFARAAAAVDALAPEAGEQIWRTDYGSPTRDAAVVLALASESGSKVVDRNVLLTRLAPSRALSTQESVWTLMAAAQLLGTGEASDILLNGAAVASPVVRLTDADTSIPQTVTNRGDDTVVTVTTIGIPSGAEVAGGAGYAITRSYLDMEGNPVDIAAVQVGQRMVAVLEITPFGRGEARLMVNDPLPAGFEIDTPSLITSSVEALADLDLVPDAAHSEFRQDRFLAAVDRMDDQPFRLGYVVRAVSPGTFHHPAAVVEDMYRPDLSARSDQGSVTIAP
ncbi:MAG: alpha-2-macroglobulin family protein [Cypionkella sp.]|nr:alpha-2-macroglobulin family protein [Cypionkella sp.]